MSQPFLHRHLPYLIDPVTGADLTVTDGGLAPHDNLRQIYPIEDGILRLTLTDIRAQSDAFDAECRALGRAAADEHTFRGLPRQGLDGWGELFWQQRSFSTAAVWDFIEAERRRQKRGSIGYQGVAADLSAGLPYMAYALDAAGYMAFAVSPYAGRYGLGVYPFSRFCRVQAAWDALPLKPGEFNLVIFSGSLASIDADALPDSLKQASRLLVDDGHLLITDSADTETARAILGDLGLRVDVRSVRGAEGRFKSMLGGKTDVPPLLVARHR
jgi:hypothetical protein